MTQKLFKIVGLIVEASGIQIAGKRVPASARQSGRIHQPKGRFRCNSGHAVIEACVAGFDICQLPDVCILPNLNYGMVELLLEDAHPDDEPSRRRS
jgi:DNA-binding transcriptional LysR family regulator